MRGAQISMIFQDPMTSFNPVLTIGRQVAEPLETHMGMTPKQANERAAELLSMVGIPNAKDRLNDYPHQFSGGMRQRVMIAMALACTPQILIADEPTTALDVTIQAQIIELVKRLRDELGMAIIWITHDLGVIAGLADRVMVMYAGYIIEEAPVKELYANPHTPTRSGCWAACRAWTRTSAGAWLISMACRRCCCKNRSSAPLRRAASMSLTDAERKSTPDWKWRCEHRAACWVDTPQQGEPR